MALTVQVDGAAEIKITAPGGTLASLGYTENGVEITENPMLGDVFGDQNGGDQGTPIEVQMFDEFHVIRMLLTKYDETVLNTIRAAVNAGTAGTVPTSGTLLFANSHFFRLVINSTNRPRNYPVVLFREPREINKGTKHSKALIIGTAYKNDSNVLYNTTTS